MKIMAINETLLPRPVDPRETSVDWTLVQGTMRTPLPDDYKEFVRYYGTGKLDKFLWVMNPVATNPNVNLINRGSVILDAFREYRVGLSALGEKIPFAAFPEPGGLLPWAFSDNGDVCYWRTGSVDPNMWRIVLNDGRQSMWEQFDGSMTEFIEALLSRRYVSDILTDDEFPSITASFEPR